MFELLVLGFIVGLLIIAMGGGGGAYYLWILTNVAHVSAASATATSLFTALPALLVGAYSHYRAGNMHFQAGNRMAISAIPTVFIGSWLTHFFSERIYMFVIGVVFVVMGIQLLKESFFPQPTKMTYSPAKAYCYGALSGLFVGVAGLSGGGPLMAGLLLMGLTMPEAAATSAYALIGTTVVGMAAHMTQSALAWGPGITLMVGAIIGAAVTPGVMKHFNRDKMTKYFRPFMGIIMLLMAYSYIF